MNREVAQRVLDDVSAVADARMRFMIGGWLVYVEDVLVGQIQEATLFIKETSFSTGFAPDLDRLPPYEGARPAVVVPESARQDPVWLSQLIQGTLTALRATKPATRRAGRKAPRA
ncbi:MAG: hypothetical protein QG608_3231 [Actinomycetota bacterium]|nr:hypothetical protein [Actinomycetota bacterium]